MRLFSMDYYVDYRDVDRYFRLRTEALMQILGRVSSFHEFKGYGFEPGYMEKRDLTWVLYQWKIIINKPRQYAKKLKITTIPEVTKGMYVYRYFKVESEGEIIAYALSHWVVVDFKSRKLSKIPEDIEKVLEGDSEGEEVLNEIKDKFNLSPIRFKMENEEKKIVIPVYYYDIDSNFHVNNAVYGRWAMEALYSYNEKLLENYYPTAIETVYKKEKLPKGEVIIKVKEVEENYFISIEDEEERLLNIFKINLKEDI